MGTTAWRALRRTLTGVASAAWAAWRDFRQDEGMLLAGALAFFSALSLAPLLLVVVGAATLLVDAGPVRAAALDHAERLLGPEGRGVTATLLDRFHAGHGDNLLSIAVAAVALFLGCTSAFVHLRTALNRVWNVRERPGHRMVRRRLYSLLMVATLGALLLASVIATTVLAAVYEWIDAWVDIPWHLLDWGVSLLVLTTLVAAVFRTLPDVRLGWRDVWLGAAVTTVLLSAGKTLFGYYLSTRGAVSAYGAAGSFVVVLLWLYYSAIVLLYGAELTQVLVTRAGRPFTPRRGAEPERPVAAGRGHGPRGSLA